MPRSATQPAITRRQHRCLMAQRTTLQRAGRMDDARWRALMAEYPRECRSDKPGAPDQGAPCTSHMHLSRRQARELITRLGVAGAPTGSGPYTGPLHRDGATTLATPAQRALIERLRAEIPWRSSFSAWLASRTSPTKGRPIRTASDAEAVIEALKNMRGAHRAETAG